MLFISKFKRKQNLHGWTSAETETIKIASRQQMDEIIKLIVSF